MTATTTSHSTKITPNICNIYIYVLNEQCIVINQCMSYELHNENPTTSRRIHHIYSIHYAPSIEIKYNQIFSTKRARNIFSLSNANERTCTKQKQKEASNAHRSAPPAPAIAPCYGIEVAATVKRTAGRFLVTSNSIFCRTAKTTVRLARSGEY